MVVTVEHLAHALFVDRRERASRIALNQEDGAVTGATLVAGARWQDTEEQSLPADDFDRDALQRLLDACIAQVEHVAPEAPEAVKDEAVLRLAAWIHESPAHSTARPTRAAWTSSGAASAVSSWSRRPAVVIG